MLGEMATSYGNSEITEMRLLDFRILDALVPSAS